ncbi:MAG: SPW repeat protein [Armatimonadetes bacterium]|nr:SPW repeat protein [Armatimonadota bacterium]
MQRAPLIALGFAGWFVSRYLAAVQLGYIPAAWEPFFGEGTRRVLHSEMSRAWPVSDAGLGAFSYTFETLMGFMGGPARWRTMPRMVLFFGILVVPLGLVHIVLVISQPVTVGYWCTLCLLAAFIMLCMIPLMLDEVVAMVQFMRYSVRKGESFWTVFWRGGTMEGGSKNDRTPDFYESPSRWLPSMVWGVTLPWTLLLSAALGVWLMAAPDVLGYRGGAASSDHLIGALIVTVAGIDTAEVARAGHFLNVLLGLWVAAAPFVLSGATPAARWNGIVAGVAVILLSLPRGPVRERYGGWDRFIA